MTMMMQAAPVADSKIDSKVNSKADSKADSKMEAMAVNSVRMTAEFEARLVEAAGRLCMSKSDVIRQALGEFLRKLEAAELMRDIELGGGGFSRDQVRAA